MRIMRNITVLLVAATTLLVVQSSSCFAKDPPAADAAPTLPDVALRAAYAPDWLTALPPAPPATQPVRTHRIVSAFSGDHTDLKHRRAIPYVIQAGGWQGFVDGRIRTEIEWGIRRFLIHNPWGSLPGEAYQFDQYIYAQEAGLTILTDGFVEAWHPITQSGVEVIAYLGKLPEDKDFLDPNRPGWFDYDRFWRSVRPAIEAGCSIAFDAVPDIPPDSPIFRCMQALRAAGMRIYIEPRPFARRPHLFDCNIISTWRFWQRSDPQRHRDAAWAARNDQLTGELLLWIDMPPPGLKLADSGWLPFEVDRILAEGHTVICWAGKLVKEGAPKTPGQVLEDLSRRHPSK